MHSHHSPVCGFCGIHPKLNAKRLKYCLISFSVNGMLTWTRVKKIYETGQATVFSLQASYGAMKKILSPQFQLYRGFMDIRETMVRKSRDNLTKPSFLKVQQK